MSEHSMTRLYWTAVAAALLTALASCPRTVSVPKDGCGKDTDCKGDRVCSAQGRCINPPGDRQLLGDVSVLAPGSSKAIIKGSPPFAMYGGDAKNSGRVAGLVPKKAPVEAWRIKTPEPLSSSPTIGPDGTVYIGSHDGKLYAVSAAGEIKWTFATGDRIWSTPAIARDGTLYIGSDDDHIYAVDTATGKQRWKMRLGDCAEPTGFGPVGVRCDADGGPTLGPDGSVYVGADGLYAIWPDGTLRWKLATSEPVRAAPAMADDGTLYAVSLDDNLYAVDPDGTKLWDLRARHDIESAPAIGADGTVYFGSDDDAIYAISADGQLRWKVLTGGDVRSSPAIGADGTIYVGSYDRRLYAVSPAGEVKWRFTAADKIHGSPVVDSAGVVLFGSQDDHLYAVDPDGRLLWFFAFDADVDSSPAISSDGVIYAASDDGTLRALKEASSGGAASPGGAGKR